MKWADDVSQVGECLLSMEKALTSLCTINMFKKLHKASSSTKLAFLCRQAGSRGSTHAPACPRLAPVCSSCGSLKTDPSLEIFCHSTLGSLLQISCPAWT